MLKSINVIVISASLIALQSPLISPQLSDLDRTHEDGAAKSHTVKTLGYLMGFNTYSQCLIHKETKKLLHPNSKFSQNMRQVKAECILKVILLLNWEVQVLKLNGYTTRKSCNRESIFISAICHSFKKESKVCQSYVYCSRYSTCKHKI